MTGFGKRIEKIGKSVFLRLLSTVVSRRRAPPDWPSRKYRVLYVRHDGIGDMILATGTLRALARSHPTIELDVLTHTKTAEMLEGNPNVHAVIGFRPSRRLAYPIAVLRRIRQRRYDVIVDGMMRRHVDGAVQRDRVKSSTVSLMLASGARHRIGMAGRPNDFIYTYPVTPPDERSVHHVEYSAALGVPFGLIPELADLRCELHISEAERRVGEEHWLRLGAASGVLRLLVNISAANERRRWPEKRYVELIEHVLARATAARVMVIAAPSDETNALRVGNASGGFAHTPALREAFALVATADVLFTPETSLGHAAAALGTPVVVLLPAGHEALVPYHALGRNLFGEDGTIASVSLEAAMGALDEILDGRA